MRETNLTIWKKAFVPLATILVFVLSLTLDVYAAETVKFQREIKSSLKLPVDVAISGEGQIYVLDQQLAKIFIFDSAGQYQLTIGEHGTGPGKLSSPSALAVSSYGEIVVADTGNSRVSVYSPDGYFLYELGNSGKLPGQFSRPTSVAVDPFGYIYVLDKDTKKLSKFSPKGVFFDQQLLDYAADDIAFDRGRNMYVLSMELGQIIKYNLEDATTTLIEYVEDNWNFMNQAVSLDVDDHGDIYIIEHAHHSVVKLDQEGNKLLSFGSEGKARGQFVSPAAIVADSDNHIYIADARNTRVQVLSVLGSDKEDLKIPDSQPPMVDYEQAIASEKSIVDLNIHKTQGLFALSETNGYILQKKDVERNVLGTTEEFSDKLRDPKALWVADDGKLYVTDTGNNRLTFLNADGTHDYNFGERGSNTGQFYGLSGVAINSDGNIYVADTQNNRIQVFNADGIYLFSIGEKDAKVAEDRTAPGIFHHPKTLAFDSKGWLYVLDSRNARIQVLSKEGEFMREIGGLSGIVPLNQPVDFALDENDYLYIADRGDHQVKVVDSDGKLVVDFGSTGMGPSYFPKLSAIDVLEGKIYVADYMVPKIKVFNFDLNRMSNDPKLVLERKKKELAEATQQLAKAEAKLAEAAKELVVVEEAVATEVLSTQKEPVTKETAMVLPAEEPSTQETQLIDEPDISLEEAQKVVGHNDMKYKISKDGTKLFATIISYPLEGIIIAEEMQLIAARKVALEVINQELAKKIGVALDAVLEYISIESEEKMENGGLKLTVSVPKEILFKKYKEAKLKRKMAKRMKHKI